MAALTRQARTAPFVHAQPGGENRMELSVPDAHCAACLRAIETSLARLDGVTKARVNLSTRKVAVTWRGAAQSPDSIVAALDRAGFAATPFDPVADAEAADEDGRFLIRCLGLAAFAAGNVMLFSVAVWAGLGGEMGIGTRTVFHVLSGLISVPVTLYAGLPFYRSAWRALRAGRANMDVPISLAVLLALALSIYQTAIGADFAYFDASVTLLFFLLIGRVLDNRLRARTRGAAQSLLALQSATARIETAPDQAATIAARDIAPGDRLIVMPGERIPVDAVVEEGVSDIDLAMVSGESLPAHVRPGDRLGGGALNLGQRLLVRAVATIDGSLVAQLVRIIEAGEQNRSRYVRLADKAARLYVPIVHTLAAAVFIGWWALADHGFAPAIHNAIATLIITCPCALGLAVPATQVVAVGRLLRANVLVKSGDALERLAEAKIAVLDKTGTLTLGHPELLPGADPADLAAAARLARASRHPLAAALARAAGEGQMAADAREIPGLGVEAVIDGQTWRLGRAGWTGAIARDDALELWFARNSAPPIRFAFHDAPRPDVAAFIDGLRQRGFAIHLLSGDREAAAARLAASLGIADYRGGILPEDKVAYLKGLAAGGAKTLMVGDGLNDAPALAAAHVSIAPASAADAAQAAADFILCGAMLSPVLEAIDVSRSARRRVLEGFAFSAVYNVFAIPFAAAGLVTPLISAIAMSGSSMVVVLNALRLLKRTPR
ncbi:MAG: heavy metal translocating P-type ATPase [Micropepsaceae bacterium]